MLMVQATVITEVPATVIMEVTLRHITAATPPPTDMHPRTTAAIPQLTRRHITDIGIGVWFVLRTLTTAAPDTMGGITADIVTIGKYPALTRRR
jgi:hypothetical protein